MNHTQQSTPNTILNWLGAGVLALLVLGLLYVTIDHRSTEQPAATSPLSSAAPVAPDELASPLAVALSSPLPPAAPAAVAPSATPPPTPLAQATALDLTVLHTNDTWGYLLPCG